MAMNKEYKITISVDEADIVEYCKDVLDMTIVEGEKEVMEEVVKKIMENTLRDAPIPVWVTNTYEYR